MKRVTVFFYGLYMDEALLRGQGLAPVNPRAATVSGLALTIGERAALKPEAGAQAWGVAFDLTHAEIDRLYDTPTTKDYREEAVLATPADGGADFPALTYNLDLSGGGGAPNAAYAEKLTAVMTKLGAPQAFIDQANSFTA